MAELSKGASKLDDEFFIVGITSDKRTFRPSDWTERLCGVMSQFRPDGVKSMNMHLQFSPYVQPVVVSGIKAVAVKRVLRDQHPLAYHFLVGFANDNDLLLLDSSHIPVPDKRSP